MSDSANAERGRWSERGYYNTATLLSSVRYAMHTPEDILRTSIEAHNDIFESLLRLIPPKYYLVKDSDPDTAVRLSCWTREPDVTVCAGTKQIPKA